MGVTMAEQIINLGNGDTVTLFKDRRSLQFNINDLYQYRLVDSGGAVVKPGTSGYVPNENDLIQSFDMGWFRVSRVDYTTYVADLVLWESPDLGTPVGDLDVLLGTGAGYASETWRCYLDTRVFPHRLQVDNQLHIRGSEAHEIRIFKGTNISASGEVISAWYVNNEYVGDAIPLELYATEKLTNIAEKVPKQGYTTRKLANSEVVTAVVYNIHGTPIDINKLLIHNTNMTRQPSDAQKRVVGIKLLSSRLSSSEPNVLEVPLNITVASLALRAQVTYSDGSVAVGDVVDEDANGKFKLMGLKYWSPTVGGRETMFDLAYEMSQNEEYSYAQGQTANGRITESYLVRAQNSDPAYSLKLYAFPTWVSDAAGYVLEYWLYDETRQTGVKVPTSAVALHPESPSFNGSDFVTQQSIKVGVTMKTINAAYGDYIHSQQFQVSLLRSGSLPLSNWKVKFSSNQTNWYGDGLMAKLTAASAGMKYLDLSNGFTTQAAWLAAMYTNTNPLYDAQSEGAPPVPTHVIAITKTRQFRIPISQWNVKTAIVNDLVEGGTMYLKWVKELANGDLQLGIGGVPVHNY